MPVPAVPDSITSKDYDKMLWNCKVRNIPCEYGICDECPNSNNRSDKDDE